MIDSSLVKQRLIALKRFKLKDVAESNYINKGFYTNRIIFVVDPVLIDLSQELRVFDEEADYKELDRELIKKLDVFNSENRNYIEKNLDKSDFKLFVTELKKMGMEQLRIHQDGSFICYDTTGHWKWNLTGKWEGFEGIELDTSNKTFQDIMNYMVACKTSEIKIKTDKKYLLVEGTGGIKVLCRGTVFEGDFESGNITR